MAAPTAPLSTDFFRLLTSDDHLYTPRQDGKVFLREGLKHVNPATQGNAPRNQVLVCITLTELCCRQGFGIFRLYPDMLDERRINNSFAKGIKSQTADPKPITERKTSPTMAFYPRSWSPGEQEFFWSLTPLAKERFCEVERGDIPEWMPVLTISMHNLQYQGKAVVGMSSVIPKTSNPGWILDHGLPDASGARDVYFSKYADFKKYAKRSQTDNYYFHHEVVQNSTTSENAEKRNWLRRVQRHGYEGLVRFLTQMCNNGNDNDLWEYFTDTISYFRGDQVEVPDAAPRPYADTPGRILFVGPEKTKGGKRTKKKTAGVAEAVGTVGYASKWKLGAFGEQEEEESSEGQEPSKAPGPARPDPVSEAEDSEAESTATEVPKPRARKSRIPRRRIIESSEDSSGLSEPPDTSEGASSP